MQRIPTRRVLVQREALRACWTQALGYARHRSHIVPPARWTGTRTSWPFSYICVASVHSTSSAPPPPPPPPQSRARLTRRFRCRLVRTLNVNVIGHPNTRRMVKRPAGRGWVGDFRRAIPAPPPTPPPPHPPPCCPHRTAAPDHASPASGWNRFCRRNHIPAWPATAGVRFATTATALRSSRPGQHAVRRRQPRSAAGSPLTT